MNRPRLEVAEVIRDYGDVFLDRYGDTLSPEQRRALGDIAAAPSSTPSRSPTTKARRPLSSTTAPAIRSRSMKSSGL